jgi:hypothetical protein
MSLTRAKNLRMQELDELIAKSTPFSVSSPSFGNPTILDFVKGLILSTNIIRVIEDHLPELFNIDWGQILAADGNTLSNECDIIIYRGKPHKLFENKRMRYVFVKKDKVRLVIQVKSSISSVSWDDKKYCADLKKFSQHIWYIAECCIASKPIRVKTIKNNLKSCGYERFIYFKQVKDDKLSRIEIIYEPFINFITAIEKLK